MAQNSINKWDDYFLGLARSVARASKDPSTQVGCVISDADNRLVSTGFNGLPRGIEDTPERLQNRELKYKLILHSEPNAIIFARRNLDKCTIYTWPFMPCSRCALLIIQAGISRVVAPNVKNARWNDEFELTKQLFTEADVELDLFDWEPEERRGSKNSSVTPLGHFLGSI